MPGIVEISDIKDRDSLNVWLNDQPREVSVRMASRAAARVLPIWWQEVSTKDWARKRDVTALPVLRGLLISSVSAKMPSEDMKVATAATAAANAARTWELLEKIALIDPKDWDQGPEVVNPMIAGIWELYRLRIEAEELRAGKEAFLAARATPEQRSHNQPPGLVEAEPEIARHVTIIWTGLDEAHEVLANDAPDKGRLRAIAGSVLEALQRVAKYCARVADTAVMSAAKVGGGAVGAALLDHVLNNGRLIQFAKDLLAWSSVGG